MLFVSVIFCCLGDSSERIIYPRLMNFVNLAARDVCLSPSLSCLVQTDTDKVIAFVPDGQPERFGP